MYPQKDNSNGNQCGSDRECTSLDRHASLRLAVSLATLLSQRAQTRRRPIDL